MRARTDAAILAKVDARDRVHAAIIAYELGVIAPGSRGPESS
jgi:hypothetical protein